jgi:hypothetical protein
MGTASFRRLGRREDRAKVSRDLPSWSIDTCQRIRRKQRPKNSDGCNTPDPLKTASLSLASDRDSARGKRDPVPLGGPPRFRVATTTRGAERAPGARSGSQGLEPTGKLAASMPCRGDRTGPGSGAAGHRRWVHRVATIVNGVNACTPLGLGERLESPAGASALGELGGSRHPDRGVARAIERGAIRPGADGDAVPGPATPGR